MNGGGRNIEGRKKRETEEEKRMCSSGSEQWPKIAGRKKLQDDGFTRRKLLGIGDTLARIVPVLK